MKRILTVILFILSTGVAPSCRPLTSSPEPLHVTSGAESINLTAHMAFFIDHDKTIDINGASGEYHDQFVHTQRPTTPFWLLDAHIWGRITIPGPLPQESFFLFLPDHTIKRLEVYFPEPGGGFTRLITGYELLPDDRPFPHRKLVIPLKNSGGTFRGGTVYFKAYSPEVEFRLDTLLVNSAGLVKEVTKDTLLDAGFLVVILVLAIYNFFIYISVRDKSYLYYVLYISTFGISVYGGVGMAQDHFHIEYFTGVLIFNATNLLLIVFVNRFVQKFLRLKKNLPRHYKILNGFNIILAALAVLQLLNYQLFYLLYNNFLMINSPFLLYTGFSLYRKYPYARDFTRAWIIFIFCTIVYTLVVLGVYIPYVTIYIMQIGGAVEAMLIAFALGRRIRYLQGEKRQYGEVKRDLAFAAKIQEHLFAQTPPESEHYNIAWRYLPSATICGDFYDYKVEDGVLSLVIVDVAGHGYAAGLIASIVKVVYHETIDMQSSVKKHQEEINRILCQHIHFIYATALNLRILPAKKEFHLVRSGHVPLLHYKKKENKLYAYSPPGPPLGIDKKYKCEQLNISYRAGDRLLAFTDGLIEELNGSGEEFGLEQLMEEFTRYADRSPEEFCEHLTRKIKTWNSVSAQRDDISFLTIEFK